LVIKLSLVGTFLIAPIAAPATTQVSVTSTSQKPWFGSRWFGFGDAWFRFQPRHGSQAWRQATQPSDFQQAHNPQRKTSVKREPKSKSAADLGAVEQSTAGLSPISKSRTMQEVAAATEVAERTTVASLANPPDNARPTPLVALVIARPEIKSVSDLAGKTIAMDERFSAFSVDVWTAFVAAGKNSIELSAGHTAAIDRLSNGEVTAAVLALVSPDAADAFPEIAGFKILRVPLLPSAS